MDEIPRHKTFISFHSEDKYYKDTLIETMGDEFVDQSVGDGDIDDSLSTDAIRQKIRDEFIRDATVIIVLVGPCTWQRKHVDWEIGSSLRNTKLNSRCGLLGILLPNHSDWLKTTYHPRLLPPRLADNLDCDDPYALLVNWQTYDPDSIRESIHIAFQNRFILSPNNARSQYKNNRSGYCWEGWKD